MIQQYFRVHPVPAGFSLALLGLRLVSGAALVLHGVGKIQSPTDWVSDSAFPEALLAIGAFAEFLGGLLLLLGLATPVGACLVIATMALAIFYHLEFADAFTVDRFGHVSRQAPTFEIAALHLVVAITVLLGGPGRMSVDAMLFGLRQRPA